MSFCGTFCGIEERFVAIWLSATVQVPAGERYHFPGHAHEHIHVGLDGSRPWLPTVRENNPPPRPLCKPPSRFNSS